MSQTCSKCLLSDDIPNVVISSDGICNYCSDHTPFNPYDNQVLIDIFDKVKKKKKKYDALVPLSGGKDSTYVLYLATKKYNLKVMTYTFDNGLMSDLAKENIEKSIEVCDVDHVWVKPEKKVIKKLYKTALLKSGEICGICGIGIERSMLKVSEDYDIPLILLGHSPSESNSFTSENLYDQARIKAILKENKEISKKEIDEFLIYPNMNFITTFLQTKLGKFGRKINLLYFEQALSDKEIGEIIKKELQWNDSEHSEYTRHFDCLAEPFTNYVREKRFGFSRRLPQLSNMIRNNEISIEQAKITLEKDQTELPDFDFIKKTFEINDDDIEGACKIPLHIYDDKSSVANAAFAKVRSVLTNKD
jgi:tRNA(Ile)-lysidine synthase TilS/MesJ